MRLSRSLFTVFLLQFVLGTILFKDILRSLLLSVMNLGFNLMMALNETGTPKKSKSWIFIILSTFISIGFGLKERSIQTALKDFIFLLFFYFGADIWSRSQNSSQNHQ